jgi:uncharacterized membrane protein
MVLALTFAYIRHNAIASLIQLVTTFLATISLLLVLICWGVAHHRFSDNNLEPQYGAAFVLVIIGWILYLLAIPFVVVGWFRERHYRTTTTTTRRRWY